MTIISILVMLLIVGVIIYAIRLAFAGNWEQLVITIVVLLLVIWVLGQFGITLPTIGR